MMQVQTARSGSSVSPLHRLARANRGLADSGYSIEA